MSAWGEPDSVVRLGIASGTSLSYVPTGGWFGRNEFDRLRSQVESLDAQVRALETGLERARQDLTTTAAYEVWHYWTRGCSVYLSGKSVALMKVDRIQCQ